jgi:ATPase family associated with various cellular activities (AAA)
VTSFANAKEQLQAELRRLDVLLQREIVRLRAAHLLSNTDLRGLYLSDAQVDVLTRRARETDGEADPDAAALTAEAQRLRGENLARTTENLPLQCLATIFGLDEFETEVLLLGVAPELNLRYELLYSYLNNDVTRKRPTCDLALRLFCPDAAERWTRRWHFAPHAPLFRCALLEWLPENSGAPASSLARSFKAPLRVVDYLLDTQSTETGLASFTRAISPKQTWDDLSLPAEFLLHVRGAGRLVRESPATVIVFEGADGAGKQSCANALCAEMGCGLLEVDSEGLTTSQADLPDLFTWLGREQRLANSGIYLRNAETLFEADGRPLPQARGLARALLRCCIVLLMVGCSEPCDLKALLPGIRFQLFRFPALPFPLRLQAWEKEMTATFGGRDGTDLKELANQFVLTAGQIRDAVQATRDDLRLRDKTGAVPSNADLFASARAQSQHELRSLAQRIELVYSWDDLVLPPATISQLREIVGAVKRRHMVYTQWGFEQRLSLGKGLKALFAGPSGTGKTMTAEVIARELGLDLYKIDLSTVVSKYIGETEKNLDRIFRAAQSSNAIIFFDEADALFGKRSEVKDAHDRYANIEVAYLLQKVEEYDGFVILATNLILNIDEAFKRRMNYTVEFPFPDEQLRERLWRTMFPPQTPLGDDLDFAFLGRQFPLSGGNIKNAALAAAFLAAASESAVQMRHLIEAVAREWQKMGKLLSAADFKQYYRWAVSPGGTGGSENRGATLSQLRFDTDGPRRVRARVQS